MSVTEPGRAQLIRAEVLSSVFLNAVAPLSPQEKRCYWGVPRAARPAVLPAVRELASLALTVRELPLLPQKRDTAESLCHKGCSAGKSRRASLALWWRVLRWRCVFREGASRPVFRASRGICEKGPFCLSFASALRHQARRCCAAPREEHCKFLFPAHPP